MTSALSKQSLEEASAWLITIESDADAKTTRQFEQWLAESPEHYQAWQRVLSFSQNLDSLPASLAKETLSRTQHRRRDVLRSMVFLGVVGGTSYWYAKRNRWLSDLHTSYGEQRQETLSDGTQLLLNSATAVNVDTARRHLDLQQGELQWRSSAITWHKPWKIITPHAVITPLGTVFDVRLDQVSTTVRVLQDRVHVALSDGQTKTLSAGQAIRVDNNTITALTTAEIQRQNAWKQGMLVANNMPLSTFIGEFSRYRRRRIEVDEHISDLRISGSFPINQPKTVLNLLSTTYGVRIERGLFMDTITR